MWDEQLVSPRDVLLHFMLRPLQPQIPSTGLITSFLQPLPYAIWSRKLSASEQFFCFVLFFVGAQTVVSLLQTTQILSGVCFITDHVAYASSNKTKNRFNRDGTLFFSSSFFTRGGCASCLRACLGARLLLQSYSCRNLPEGVDRVGGQLRGDKEWGTSVA